MTKWKFSAMNLLWFNCVNAVYCACVVEFETQLLLFPFNW